MKKTIPKILTTVIAFGLLATVLTPITSQITATPAQAAGGCVSSCVDGSVPVTDSPTTVIPGTDSTPGSWVQTQAPALPGNQSITWTNCSGNGTCSGSKTSVTVATSFACRSVLYYGSSIEINNSGSHNIAGMRDWFFSQGVELNEAGIWVANSVSALNMFLHFQFGNTGSITNGSFSYNSCVERATTVTTPGTKAVTCPPQYGRDFPFAVRIMWLQQTDRGRAAGSDGFRKYYPQDVKRAYVGGTPKCMYVPNSVKPKQYLHKTEQCLWNVRYSGARAFSKSAILGGGTAQPVRVYTADSSVSPSIGKSGANATLNNCSKLVGWGAEISTAPDGATETGYGYYKIAATVTRQEFHFYRWDTAWTSGSSIISRIEPGTKHNNLVQYSYGVYSCSVNGGNYRDVGTSQGSLPGSITLNAADCRNTPGNPEWECVMSPNPNVNATGGPGNTAYVMRDGRNNTLTLPQLTLHGNVRDPITKTNVISDANSSYKTNVPGTATPRNGTDNNNAKQYFKMTKADGTTKENFGTWNTGPNSNRDKNIAFYWANNPGTSWNMTYEARLNYGEYRVPRINWSRESPTYHWVVSELGNCNLPGDKNATVANSNSVVVERSTQSG